MKTLIENGTVIAWIDGRHQVLDSGVVVYAGNEIEFVGGQYEGEAETVIDATGRIVMPGLVNCHLHATDTLYTKGYIEEVGVSYAGVPQNFASLYKVLPAVRKATDPDAQVAAAFCVFAELAMTGSTTVGELGHDFEIGGNADIAITERVAEVAGQSGLRCYSGPRYRTRYFGDDGQGGVFYKNFPHDGRERFEACITYCRDWNGKYDDRLRTMLAPGQIDTCDAKILEDTRRYADELKIPIQIHAGQSLIEFARIAETEGKSTIQYMMDTGLLGSDFIIGYGLIFSGDGDLLSVPEHELAALRDSGTTICHLPWNKVRRGGVINSIQKYRDMGVRQCLGTDTYPFDIIKEMRIASVLCKIVENSALAGLSTDVFHMATVGGADALGRPDLGRLAPGCKADIVFVRTDTPKATPLYNPIKFLVHAASGEDVDRVVVDGETIVKDGEMKTIDVSHAIREVNKASKRVWDRVDL